MAEQKEKRFFRKHIVLTFDICSSTNILEDLHRTENIEQWRKFLIWMKKYLREDAKSQLYDLYKFTGDGWILLFKFDCPGKALIKFIEDFCKAFEFMLNKDILSILETRPEVIGLTFGMDRGTLVKILMNSRNEYVGRAINVACRLQGAIKDKDSAPQYKILMTNHLYNFLRNDLADHKCVEAKRKLRNIAGDKVVGCRKVFLSLSKSSR